MKSLKTILAPNLLRMHALAGSIVAAATLMSLPALAQDQARVVCIGEQTTHSAHRENDPEYPLLMGPILDDDFVADNDQHPDSGGFLYGGGTAFRIANLGVPKGSVLNAETGDAKPVLGRNELNLADDFEPDVVVLGPFGSHEALTNRNMDNFSADLIELIERIEGFGSQPEVLIALPLPHGADNGGSNGGIYQQVHDDSAAVAADRGMQTIDLWTPFLDQGQFFNDATHLSEPGRQELAEIVGAALIQWARDQAAQGSGGAGNDGGNGGGSSAAGGGGVGGQASAGGMGTAAGAGGTPSVGGSAGMGDNATGGMTAAGDSSAGGPPTNPPAAEPSSPPAAEPPSPPATAPAQPTAPAAPAANPTATVTSTDPAPPTTGTAAGEPVVTSDKSSEGTGCVVSAAGNGTRSNPPWMLGLAALGLLAVGRRRRSRMPQIMQ